MPISRLFPALTRLSGLVPKLPRLAPDIAFAAVPGIGFGAFGMSALLPNLIPTKDL